MKKTYTTTQSGRILTECSGFKQITRDDYDEMIANVLMSFDEACDDAPCVGNCATCPISRARADIMNDYFWKEIKQ